MDFRLPAALVLLAAGAVASEASDACRATPRPAPGLSSVLGGFTAIAAQVVWFRADEAVLANDEDRALTLLRTLVDLEPHVVSASRQAAHEIGWNLVQGRSDPATRWSLAAEAVRILSDCIRRNPGSAEALRNRGRYLTTYLMSDDALAAAYTRNVDRRGPAGTAFDDFGRALDMAPDDTDAAGGLAQTGGRLGVEAADAGRWADAVAPLRAAVRGWDVTLADVRVVLAREIAAGGREADELARAEDGRAALAELLQVAEAPAAERDGLLTEFRRRRPGLLR